MLSWSIRILFKSDLVAGLFFTLFSFMPLASPELNISGKVGSLVMGASFYLGVLLIGNHITRRLGGLSLITIIRGSANNNRRFTEVVWGGAIFFSLIAADLGGLWYFPYWSATDYIFIGFILGGWVFYVLTLLVCYESVKLILDRIIRQRKRVTRYYRYEKHLYTLLFAIGLVILLIVMAEALKTTHFFSQFHYSVNIAKKPYLTWYYWILTFVATLFICEYVEYSRKRTSLIKDTLHGYFNPLLATVLAGLIVGFADETQNFGVHLWRYANYPWPGVMMAGVPIFILIAWPIHIVVFTEFWRAFGNGSSSIVFANSKSIRKRRRSAPRRLVVAAAGARR